MAKKKRKKKTTTFSSRREERRRLRRQRREIRREAFAYMRENPDADEIDLQEHLEDEFSDENAAISPELLSIIVEIVKLLIEWFSKR